MAHTLVIIAAITILVMVSTTESTRNNQILRNLIRQKAIEQLMKGLHTCIMCDTNGIRVIFNPLAGRLIFDWEVWL